MSSLMQIHEPGQTPAPHEDTAVVGIDLGTTHSVVSVMHNGELIAIEDASGRSIIPSIVTYGTNGVVVGDASRIGDDVISSVKRLMGKTVDEAKLLLPALANRIISAEGDAMPRVKLGGAVVTPVALSADILRALKNMAEEATGKDVREAVITVPAYFDDAARSATKDAATLAGLEVLRLINEPTAAAMAYGLDTGVEGVYAIYDLGGGTFDISLLNLEAGVFQVLSTGGDTALGGDDVDQLIAEAFIAENAGVTLDMKLLLAAKAAKEALGEDDSALMQHDGKSFTLDKAGLATIIEAFVEKTLSICASVLHDAETRVFDIKGVVLVGGSTRLQAVRDGVEGFFGQPGLMNVDPDRVVSFGAAAQAHNLTQGGENLLLDVTPLSLGLETMGGVVEKVIWRNTPTPTAMAQEFTTYKDGQTAMSVHVVQGEREKVDDCRSLARFELRGIPAMAAGSARIKVMFQVDADGLLTVSATEETTGVSQEVAVKPTYGLPLDEMERMLRESMEHAEDDIYERLIIEARVEGERLISDTRSALGADSDLLSEEEIATIQRSITALEAAVHGDDRDMIDSRNQHLQHIVGKFAQKRMDKAIANALKGSSVDDIDEGVGE